jgi:pimeloyl-ACP methyl ester carboxylesterase
MLLLSAAKCGGDTWQAQVTVDGVTALADQAVHVRIQGVPAGHRITLALSTSDYSKAEWRSEATFTADHDGTIDLDRDAPQSGSYSNVDGMGLFSSIAPADGRNPDESEFLTIYPDQQASYDVQLSARDGKRTVGQATLHRVWTAPGVTSQMFPDIDGDLFTPGGGNGPAVLAFGGSEGGNSARYEAALLASHGFPALAIGYFGAPGLPKNLENIPIEYFGRAIERLHQLTGRPVVIMGYSRGSEAALLAAQDFPQWVRGVVVYSSADRVNPGFPNGGSAWTYHGQPIPAATALRATVPVLDVVGGDDHIWTSQAYAERLAASVPHLQTLTYPNAGHLVGVFPYRPVGVDQIHPETGQRVHMGGSRVADDLARRDNWPKVLAFLSARTP